MKIRLSKLEKILWNLSNKNEKLVELKCEAAFLQEIYFLFSFSLGKFKHFIVLL